MCSIRKNPVRCRHGFNNSFVHSKTGLILHRLSTWFWWVLNVWPVAKIRFHRPTPKKTRSWSSYTRFVMWNLKPLKLVCIARISAMNLRNWPNRFIKPNVLDPGFSKLISICQTFAFCGINNLRFHLSYDERAMFEDFIESVQQYEIKNRL